MGTHFRGPPAQVDALDAYIKLMRAADSVTTRAHAILPPGLTLSQFGVLEALLHCGPLCQSELATKLLKSGGNITLVVDNLERGGWVRRERDQRDRRFITVLLTTKGRSFIQRLFPKIAESIAQQFSSLSTEEQATLGALCRKVGKGSCASASAPTASRSA